MFFFHFGLIKIYTYNSLSLISLSIIGINEELEW